MPLKRKEARRRRGDEPRNDNEEALHERESENRPFGALLAPIKDIIAKDWTMKIGMFLDSYIAHLRREGRINFPEAGLIVHHSALYLGKRVDLMWSWIRDFAMSLSSNKEFTVDQEEGEVARDVARPRKNKRREDLVSEDLELIELTSLLATHRIHIRLDQIGLDEVPKALLNTHLNMPSKSGTSCQIFQKGGEEMGFKEEFRTHDLILSNGRLYPDFRPLDSKLSFEDDDCELNADMSVNVGREMLDHSEMAVDVLALAPDSPRRSPSPAFSDIADVEESKFPNELPQEQPPPPPPEPDIPIIPFRDLIIHKKLKRCKIFTLPSDMISEVRAAARECIRVQKERGDDKPLYNMSFSALLGGKAEDFLSFKLRRRERERLEILSQKRQKKKTKKEEVPEINIENALEEDLNDDTNDDNVDFDDFRDDAAAGAPVHGDLNVLDDVNFDLAYAETARLARLNRKRDNILSVANRVSAWHEMIAPALEVAEQRSKFDIHAYGTEIIEKIGEVGAKKTFFEIAAGKEKKDICRYFLSSLMLANTSNVELIPDGAELSTDNFELKLISTVRHHEELDVNIGEAAAGTNH